MLILTLLLLLLVSIFLILKYLLNSKIELFTNNKMSVIILSYNRPHNIEDILKKITKYRLIDEIIISHGSKKFYKKYNYKKIKNIIDIKNNNIYRAARRFFNIKYVKNDIVMFLDDDILPSEDLVNEAYNKIVNSNTNTFYGKYKRTCNKNGYIPKSHITNNIILTGLSICKKNIIKEYLNNKNGFAKYKKFLIKHKGNCEDLAFNAFIINHYKTKPQYLNGSYIELDNSNGYSSDENHYKIRDMFCKKYISL